MKFTTMLKDFCKELARRVKRSRNAKRKSKDKHLVVEAVGKH
jgi:hypothetical protein